MLPAASSVDQVAGGGDLMSFSPMPQEVKSIADGKGPSVK